MHATASAPSRPELTRADLLRLSNARHVEHMAVLLAFSEPRVDLNHCDAPIIYLTTCLADHDIRFIDVHLAVTRALELRRDAASAIDEAAGLCRPSPIAAGAGLGEPPIAAPAPAARLLEAW